MAERSDVQAALDDLAAHLAWPGAAADVTARAVAELRDAPARAPGSAPVPGAPARPVGDAGRRPPRRAGRGLRRRTGRGPGDRPDRRPDPRLRRRTLVAVAVAVAGTVLAVSTVGEARHALADLLGLGGVRITRTDAPLRPIDDRLDLGRRVTLAEAGRLSPGPLPRPAALDPPAAAFAGQPAGGITLVWAPDETMPEVLDFDVGLLITAFPGSVDASRTAIEKRTAAGGTVELTDVHGAPAYWLAGEPHELLYVDEHGHTRQEAIRLSGSALVWEHGGVTYRLESALPRSDAVRLAESLPR